ncbi:6-carboxytetrahydropterin synthase, partial [Enterobacter sp. Cy-1797]|uniref:6-carboxytetrahydropterin synthase n=1 Tax=Enterobacter sp. Cy-1797 TaxID=2608342 RepID=UPI001B39E0DF
IDFGALSTIWKTEVEPLLDHQDLNDTVGSRGCWPTTAENLAHWIGETFTTHGVAVAAVSVWETPTSRSTAHWNPL